MHGVRRFLLRAWPHGGTLVLCTLSSVQLRMVCMHGVLQALLAGFFLNACQYQTTEYDRLKADDRGTHVYAMLRVAHAPQAGGAAVAARLAVDASSVLAHVRPQWLVFASCQQTSEGLWRMSDTLATDAESLAAAAPHVFERAPQTRR